MRMGPSLNHFVLSSVLLIFCYLTIHPCEAATCTKISDCQCSYDDGNGNTGTVDISDLGNQDPTTPMFGYLYGYDANIYDVNMCYPMSIEPSCLQCAICQTTPDGMQSIIGESFSTEFSVNEFNDIVVTYSSIDGFGQQRKANILLTCEPTTVPPYYMIALGEGEPNEYTFAMYTKDACVSAGPPQPIGTTKKPGGGGGGGNDGGISTGTILVIVVLVVALVYVVAGSVFLRVRRQASGKDMVPNVEFWSSIPGLIKEGFKFTYGKCRGRSGYEGV